MNNSDTTRCSCCMSRRGFLGTVGATAAGASLSSVVLSSAAFGAAPGKKARATVRGAFLYPPTETLRQAGYYSWPGSTFDAEGHQIQYEGKLRAIERELGVGLSMNEKPLDDEGSVAAFIADVNQSKPDGLLLIPFKKGHWGHVTRIVEETSLPTVVFVPLGILLVDHISELHTKPGVYLINSEEDFEALADGLRMFRAARCMKDARLICITGSETKETTVPHLGTLVRTLPHERFYEEFRQTTATEPVRDLAASYLKNAKDVVEPTKADILEGAKCYFALKRIIEAEQADAIMMNCLPGLQKPHKHVPPCMAFMSLRDEGVPAGCQADLNATLTLMLVQYLFDRPGFQQNASMNTKDNLYFGAHCTSPSRMNGPNKQGEPYVLRSHAEAGWGCVPRVLFKKGQAATMALYMAQDPPQMLVYSGEIVRCPDIPPTGGCRTNVEMTINEVNDVCDVKGMHQIIFYGSRAKDLRSFCQLYGIQCVS